jgi:hypothetical protein
LTPEQARELAAALYPGHVELAADLITTSVHGQDQAERECAASALEQLPMVLVPEFPPVPDADATLRGRTERRLARAGTLMFSVMELRRWAEAFKDAELNRALGTAHGRLLTHVMAARKTLESCL